MLFITIHRRVQAVT